jgi:hypothetical protein
MTNLLQLVKPAPPKHGKISQGTQSTSACQKSFVGAYEAHLHAEAFSQYLKKYNAHFLPIKDLQKNECTSYLTYSILLKISTIFNRCKHEQYNAQ